MTYDKSNPKAVLNDARRMARRLKASGQSFRVAPDDYVAACEAALRLRQLETDPWRPIEECGELERDGLYLVLTDNGRGSLIPHLDTWRAGTYWSSHLVVTHVHALGPIRGPGEG